MGSVRENPCTRRSAWPFITVILLAAASPVALAEEPATPCDPVASKETPRVAARDGTPIAISVQLAPCTFEEYTEIRVWLGNATHQASRLHDQTQWVTSQHYAGLEDLPQDDGHYRIGLQANPDAAHAPVLIEDAHGTTAWLRLRGTDNTTQPIALGPIQWVDADRVEPYWGQPDGSWMAVRDPDGLAGSALQGFDKDGAPLPAGFAWIALPPGAPASPAPPVAPGDLLLARMIPRLHEGGSLIEVHVSGPIDNVGGLRLQGRSGELVVPKLDVEAGTVIRITDQENAPVAPLADQLDGSWGEPVVIAWDQTDEAGTGVDALAAVSGRFQFARSGGSLSLVYGDIVLDSFAYGDAPPPASWRGENMEATRVDARSYLRDWNGETFTDTDTALDWQRPRIHRQHTSDLETRWFNVEGPVRAWVCPDRCHEETLLRIQDAEESIDANLYELTLPSVVEALGSAAERGVQVRVLVHDRPVGASATRMDQVAWSVDRLDEAGAHVRTLNGDRYDVNHAKYLVFDNVWTLVTTENAVQRGWPSDGQSGNRGHGVAVRDPELAEWTTRLFETDYEHPEDARDVTGNDLHPDQQPVNHPPEALVPPPPTHDRTPTLVIDGGFPVAPVLAPDHLGDPGRNPIAETLLQADEEIGLAQMNLPLRWNRAGHSQDSPLAAAMIDAAASGVRVTGTLADAFIEDPERDGNHRRAAALHAMHGSIDLRLGGAPHPGGVVHAKTWWTDPGSATAVAITGSANGNLASQALNRELNLLLANPDIAQYWAQVGAQDHGTARHFSSYAPDSDEDPTVSDRPHETPFVNPILLVGVLLATTVLTRTAKKRATVQRADPPPPDRS